MNKVLIGLGSNIENRLDYLRSTIAELTGFLSKVSESKIYETAPWGKTDQAHFLNMCLTAETDLAPLELLRQVKTTEEKIGRQKRETWGPREIDIDIIAYNDLILSTDDLQIPHPHLAERQFVLLPLSNIAADWRHPILKETIQELSNKLPKDAVKLFSKP